MIIVMNNIYITTAHTGYNYGTYLQAYAMKKFMGQFADNAEIVWEKSFGPKGRDFRIKKVFSLGIRSVLHHKQFSSIKQGYAKNFAAEPSDRTKQLFDRFSEECLDIKEYSYRELIKLAANCQTKVVVCGSDQIWNASSMYPDPLYYLQFAPKKKRIAYAPSFGRSEVPDYNKKRIERYLRDIPAISVREDAGAEIVMQLTGRKVPVVPDPTLIVDWDDWMTENNEEFLLLYFLDQPTDNTIRDISNIQKLTGLKVKVLLHDFDAYTIFENRQLVDAGPKEFVEIISSAKFVCTDSFHASIFSMLAYTPFYTYKRNYGMVDTQESRLDTLFRHYRLEERYRKNPGDSQSLVVDYNMEHVKEIRNNDITHARRYMAWALENSCCTGRKNR